LDESAARALIAKAEYGVLSMSGQDGDPYGIPINYVWDGGDLLYVHCAPDGRKLRLLRENPKVSFCIVGSVKLQSTRFTTVYESVVMKGTAELVETDEERWQAIRLILRKLAPEHIEEGIRQSQRSFGRVAIVRIRVSEFSGKCKRMD